MKVDAKPEVTVDNVSAVATTPSYAVAEIGNVSGEYNGMRIPHLRMAYGVGSLATDFTNGDLVLCGSNENDRVKLAGKGEKLSAIVVSAIPYIKDRLTRDEFQMKVKANRYRNRIEAKAAGRVTEWPPRGTDGAKPNITDAIDIRMLVKMPDTVDSDWFNIVIGGERYAAVDSTWDKDCFATVATSIVKRMNLIRSIAQSNKRKLELDPTATPGPIPLPCFFAFWTSIRDKGPTIKIPVINSSPEAGKDGKLVHILTDEEHEDLKLVLDDILQGTAADVTPDTGTTGSDASDDGDMIQ